MVTRPFAIVDQKPQKKIGRKSRKERQRERPWRRTRLRWRAWGTMDEAASLEASVWTHPESGPDLIRMLLNRAGASRADFLNRCSHPALLPPLLMVSQHDDPAKGAAIAQFLLDEGADVHVDDGGPGCTALFMGAQEGNPELVRVLLSHGARVDAATTGAGDGSRKTPMWIATYNGNYECAARIAAAGVAQGLAVESDDAGAGVAREGFGGVNSAGVTAAAIAVEYARPIVLGILSKAGADLRRAAPAAYSTLPYASPRDFRGSQRSMQFAPDPEMEVHFALDNAVRSRAGKVCVACGVTADALLSCSSCQVAYVCGPECQRASWSTHKTVCKKIKKGRTMFTDHLAALQQQQQQPPPPPPADMCGACGAPNPSQRCSKCKSAIYCDRTCQTQAWKKGHKQECKKRSCAGGAGAGGSSGGSGGGAGGAGGAGGGGSGGGGVTEAGGDKRGKGKNKNKNKTTKEVVGFVEAFGPCDDVYEGYPGNYNRFGNNESGNRAAIWEYDAGRRGKQEWRRYPSRIEASCEDFCGISPNSLAAIMGGGGHTFMYRPGGGSECDGMSERGGADGRRSPVAPPNVATRYVEERMPRREERGRDLLALLFLCVCCVLISCAYFELCTVCVLRIRTRTGVHLLLPPQVHPRPLPFTNIGVYLIPSSFFHKVHRLCDDDRAGRVRGELEERPAQRQPRAAGGRSGRRGRRRENTRICYPEGGRGDGRWWWW